MIRRATLDDAEKIVAMGERFFASTHYSEFAEYDNSHARALVERMIDSGVLLVADDGDIIGMVGLVIAPFVFDPRLLVAYELMWWVAPEHQARGIGRKLIEAIPDKCKESGADVIQMIHLDNSPPAAKALYEKLGFKAREHSFFLRL